MSNKTIGICIEMALYPYNEAVISDIKESGFNSVIGCAHVMENGDIKYDTFTKPLLVQNGQWIDNSANAAFKKGIQELKEKIETFQLLFSNMLNIKNLIFPNKEDYPDNPQIGPNSILYKNFKALKEAIPIDGINFDFETDLDKPSIVAFGHLLNTLGYQVTYCPYYDPQFWASCLKASDEISQGMVSSFYLQCYGGGTGQNPCEWDTVIKNVMGNDFPNIIFPGLYSIHDEDGKCNAGWCPKDVTTTLKGYNCDLNGAWIFLYDCIAGCKDSGKCPGSMDARAYAQAVIEGLS